MKRYFALISLLMLMLCASAQTKVYIRGSAVPGGVQELERFSTTTTGKYTFRFHGTLLPGNLYLTNTATPKSVSFYYAPKLVDTNIVCEATAYSSQRDSIGAEWGVLFEADNYRFTFDPTAKTVTGELFTPWYEAWICGGCVEDAQNETGKWELTSGKAMQQDWTDRYVWTWTGELKNYTSNVEPKRFKINGQYGWSPKVLHPFTQDASILTAKQLWYNGSQDYKWSISKDGYYRITVDVFRETITGEYLGTEAPDGFHPMPEAEADLEVHGRQITLQAAQTMNVRLFTTDGQHCLTASGANVTMTAPAPGIYILYATDGAQNFIRKVAIE